MTKRRLNWTVKISGRVLFIHCMPEEKQVSVYSAPMQRLLKGGIINFRLYTSHKLFVDWVSRGYGHSCGMFAVHWINFSIPGLDERVRATEWGAATLTNLRRRAVSVGFRMWWWDMPLTRADHRHLFHELKDFFFILWYFSDSWAICFFFFLIFFFQMWSFPEFSNIFTNNLATLTESRNCF